MAGIAELSSIVGADAVRTGEESDAIDGVTPAAVVLPATIEEVSRVMALAHGAGLRVAPRGGGTKLNLGNPPTALDLIVDLSRMDRVLEYSSGDLVVAVEAGLRVDALQEHLRAEGQMLALDSREAGATVGGVIATNSSGARRYRYGTVRDLLIGVTVVLADGTVAKAGGKVVKNVAGYDLAKLMTGSLGTLGILVKSIFRLHPMARSRRLVEVTVGTPEGVAQLVQRVLHSSLVPSAIQLAWPLGERGRIGILLEGEEPSVAAQAETAVALLGPEPSPRVYTAAEFEVGWLGFQPPAPPPEALEIRVSCRPASLAEAIGNVQKAAARHRGRGSISGALGNGIVSLRLEKPEIEVALGIVREVRARIQVGSAVLVAAPVAVKRQIDVWGAMGDALPLMKRVKAQFDPDGILNPGRFVGGI